MHPEPGVLTEPQTHEPPPTNARRGLPRRAFAFTLPEMDAPARRRCPVCQVRLAWWWPDGVIDCSDCGIFDEPQTPADLEDAKQATR